jgi:hypothetical protein
VAQPSSLEHIIPESLGNDDLVLTNDVCASCNNFFSKIENYVLEKTEIAFWRSFLGIRTKKGKLPSVVLSQPKKRKGTYPDFHTAHDSEVGFSFHEDGSCSVDISSDETVLDLISGEKDHFKFVMTPKVLHNLGRFFCKIGVELICSINPEDARSDRFRRARDYARHGSNDELWPLFHYTSGNISDLMKFIDNDCKEVTCYDYSLLEFSEYILLRLKVGTSNWVVCLNDQWPMPTINSAFSQNDLKLIWYPKESFR